MEKNNELKNLKRKAIIRISFIPVFIGLLVLLPAGTFFFWQAYLYFSQLLLLMIAAGIYFFKKDPQFLARRMRMKEKEQKQKIFVLLASVSILSAFIIPGLDYRFGWSQVPLPVVLSADILVLISYLFILYVFKINSYASRIIEVNEGQKVISTGPYAVVRHPMYSGILLMYIMTPLALASYWGLIAIAFLPILLAFRIKNEENVLSRQLNGYNEYCIKVKYRLIPFIW